MLLHFIELLLTDVSHFQIIKNNDLEELQELGSGTFGTVYHGKWRGTDVAIKRINDRCFSGKPSEQERTVTIFTFNFWTMKCLRIVYLEFDSCDLLKIYVF